MTAPQKIAFYLRVSTADQDFPSQLLALTEYCRRQGWRVPPKARQFAEKKSGKNENRAALENLLRATRTGQVDTILAYSMSRIGRSASHLLNLYREWDRAKIRVIAVADGMDSFDGSAADKFKQNMSASVAQFDSDRISENTRAGLAAARRRGRMGGRPRKKDAQIARAFTLRMAGKLSLRKIAAAVGLHPSYVSMLFNGQRKTGKTK